MNFTFCQSKVCKGEKRPFDKREDRYFCLECGAEQHQFLDAHPAFCPERNCFCLWHGIADDVDRGYSLMCFGRMKEPVTFTVRGGGKDAVHDNQFYSCSWTPLKGWVQFQVTLDDLYGELHGLLRSIELAEEGLNRSPLWLRLMHHTKDGRAIHGKWHEQVFQGCPERSMEEGKAIQCLKTQYYCCITSCPEFLKNLLFGDGNGKGGK